MSNKIRNSALAVAVATALLFTVGCQKGAEGASGSSAAATKLNSEKDKISYTIGMDIANSLEPAKDEVDVDMIARAIKDAWAGREPALTEEQANETRSAFAEKMQAQQLAEMMAKARKNAEDGTKFLEENAKKEGVHTTESGLQYEVLTEGSGAKPGENAAVKVHYTGKLLDGTVFDDSTERSEPTTFTLAQVVPGWAEGIRLMSPGAKYRFWLPANLAYGEQGTPGGPIPPNATLQFDVELLEVVPQ